MINLTPRLPACPERCGGCGDPRRMLQATSRDRRRWRCCAAMCSWESEEAGS